MTRSTLAGILNPKWTLFFGLPLLGCSLLIDAEELSHGKRSSTNLQDAGSAGALPAFVKGHGIAGAGRALVSGNGGESANQAGSASTGGSPAEDAGGAGGTAGELGTDGGRAGAGGGSAGAGGRGVEEPKTFVYNAQDMLHLVGRAEADGWAASVVSTSSPGFLAYGPAPYPTNWGKGEATVAFHLLVDDNERDEKVVATINLVDVDLGVTLLSKDIRRSDFVEANKYQVFKLPAVSLAGRQGHGMDSQVYFHNIAYVRVAKVVVTTR